MLLSPNERRVAEDRRDCYWLYVVTELLAHSRHNDCTQPSLESAR